jgi:hypothetical protein
MNLVQLILLSCVGHILNGVKLSLSGVSTGSPYDFFSFCNENAGVTFSLQNFIKFASNFEKIMGVYIRKIFSNTRRITPI